MNKFATCSSLLLLSFFIFVGPACSDRSSSNGTENVSSSSRKPVVQTSFYPLYFFAKKICGSHCTVRSPLPENRDPRHWMPDRNAIGAFQDADVIVLNGADLEGWVSRVSLPRNRVLHTADAFKPRWIKRDDVTKHKHGSKGEHTHTATDPNTWLAPKLALLQARRIFRKVKTLLPEKTGTLRKHYLDLKKELENLNKMGKRIAKKHNHPALLSSDPAYRYIAREWNMNIDHLPIHPNKRPSKDVIQKLKRRMKQRTYRAILWPEPPDRTVRTFYRKKFQLESVPFRLLKNPPKPKWEEPSYYLTAMKKNLNQLSEALKRTEEK